MYTVNYVIYRQHMCVCVCVCVWMDGKVAPLLNQAPRHEDIGVEV
jgi:hypothetical protein